MARGKADRSEGRIGLILLVGLAIGLLVTQRGAAQERRAAPLLASDIEAPVAAMLARPFRAIEASIASAEDRRQALEENRVLRDELAQLRRESARLAAMRARLSRLEAVMDVRVNGDIPTERITARVVSDPASPFVRSLLIGAGRVDGVADGHAVMSDAGLVGHIVSAGRRSARVLRLDDLNSRVAVMSERSGARAILVGQNADAPTLRFVSDADGWSPGDRVVTSGDDGRLPQGLPVGTLVEARAVRLDFRAKPVDWVLVVPYVPPADGGDVESDDSGAADAAPDGGAG